MPLQVHNPYLLGFAHEAVPKTEPFADILQSQEPAPRRKPFGRCMSSRIAWASMEACAALVLGLLVLTLVLAVFFANDAEWEPRLMWLGVLLCCFLSPCAAAWIIARAVKATVEIVDQHLADVDIGIGALRASWCCGRVEMDRFTVSNPRSGRFSHGHFMEAENIIVDVSLGRFLRTCGRELEIEELVIDKLGINLEYDGYLYGVDGTSNLWAVMQYIQELRVNGLPDMFKSRVRVSLKSIRLENAGITIVSGPISPHVALGNINAQDFNQDYTEDMAGLILWVLETISKNALSNLPFLGRFQCGT